MIQVLLVDGVGSDRGLISAFVNRGLAGNVQVHSVSTLENALELAAQFPLDVCLLELNLPDSSGMETLSRFRDTAPAVPVVVLASEFDREMSLQAVANGAHDYFSKVRMNPDAIARVVRFAIERGRRLRIEQDVRAAEKVQRRLFPQIAPELEDFDISGNAISAEHACGDYFDYIRKSETSWIMAVADVSGHGLAAALRMVEIRSLLHAFARDCNDLGVLLGQLNDLIVSDADELGQFITMFLAVMDSETETIQFAAAGHDAYILKENGESHRLHSSGLPLGIAQQEYQSDLFVMEPGDVLLIATDGIAETSNKKGKLFGTERILDIIRSHMDCSSQDIIYHIHQANRLFAEGTRRADDQTLIIAKRKPVLVHRQDDLRPCVSVATS